MANINAVDFPTAEYFMLQNIHNFGFSVISHICADLYLLSIHATACLGLFISGLMFER